MAKQTRATKKPTKKPTKKSTKKSKRRVAKRPARKAQRRRRHGRGPRTLAAAIPIVTTAGVDVSHHQGAIDWAALGAAVAFAYIKATEGATGAGSKDSMFAINWPAARMRVLRGAYHFFTWTSNPDKQADNFLATVGALEATDLPPMLDLEATAGIGALTLAQRVARVRRWIDRIERDLKRQPVLYVTQGYMRTHFEDGDFFADVPLFAVDFNRNPPRLPRAWADWTFWQHSETGTVSGVTGAVDLDRFQGDQLALQMFIEQSVLP